MLTTESISKFYQRPEGKINALEKVSFDLAAGEFITVQGKNGAGKTTILLTVGGLLVPDEGRVVVAGQDLYALTPEARARFRGATIGFVFQEFHLIPYLSVMENVLTPSLAMPAADAPERARELIGRFDLLDRIHHFPAELSTGERQRTALARALLNRPKLLLADEPTGNLDRENAAVILRYLAEFAEAGGAVLLVTHDIGIAEYGGSRALNLKEGRIFKV